MYYKEIPPCVHGDPLLGDIKLDQHKERYRLQVTLFFRQSYNLAVRHVTRRSSK